MAIAALPEPDLGIPDGETAAPAVASEDSLCTVCGQHPRFPPLARCRECLRKAAAAQLAAGAEAKARVQARKPANGQAVSTPASVSDLTGQTFGRLKVLAFAGPSKQRGSTWRALCECGQNVVVKRSDLTRGSTRSCGCLRRELTSQRSTRHGHARGGGKSPTYRSWFAMMGRCSNPKNRAYKHYGVAGIRVAGPWHKFENFLADMGERPEGHTLDRKDPHGGYSKANARWATPAIQGANKRNTRRIAYLDQVLTIPEWASRTGLSRRTTDGRLRRGWSIADSLTKPPRSRRLNQK